MRETPTEKATKHVKTGYSAIKTKFHLEEVIGGLIDVVSRFHHSIGRFLEITTERLPIINLLLEAVGHVAAVTRFRKKKTTFDKAALGIKVTAGLITFAIAIAAFAVPHISVPLIVAGSSINLVHDFFSLYKTNRKKKKLEHTLKTIPLQNEQARQQVIDKITSLNKELLAHKNKIKSKTLKTITSTIALVGVIIMLANPITVAPVSIILAVTSIAYTSYHFRKPILSGINRLVSGIKNIFVKNTDADTPQPAPQLQDANTLTSSATNRFLQHQQNTLAQQHHDTFAQHHQPTTMHNTADISEFLAHEESILKSIATTKNNPNANTKIVSMNEEDDDDGGGDGRGDLDASRETQPEPELRM